MIYKVQLDCVERLLAEGGGGGVCISGERTATMHIEMLCGKPHILSLAFRNPCSGKIDRRLSLFCLSLRERREPGIEVRLTLVHDISLMR